MLNKFKKGLKEFKSTLKDGKFKGEGNVLGGGSSAEEQRPSSVPGKEMKATANPPPAAAAAAPVPLLRPQPAPAPRPQADREKVLQAALDRQKPKARTAPVKKVFRDFQAEERAAAEASASSPSSSLPESCIEEMQFNMGLLISQDSGAAAASLMKRIFINITRNPHEPKYQKLRLDNPKIAQTIVEVQGAVGFMNACGFKEQMEEGDEGSTKYLVLEDREVGKLVALQEGLLRMEKVFPTPKPESSPSNTPAESSDEVDRGRDTQLLLMKPTEAEVPSWFFDRMASEIKEEYMVAKKKSEASKVLMTSAWRKALAEKGRKQFSSALIRIRLPEGVLLQGSFKGKEPLVRIYEWVAECLREPNREFQLFSPTREPLSREGTVAAGSLMPAALLNFRWSDEILNTVPTVSDKVLALARIDWD